MIPFTFVSIKVTDKLNFFIMFHLPRGISPFKMNKTAADII
jgi:hypothetical protein